MVMPKHKNNNTPNMLPEPNNGLNVRPNKAANTHMKIDEFLRPNFSAITADKGMNNAKNKVAINSMMMNSLRE